MIVVPGTEGRVHWVGAVAGMVASDVKSIAAIRSRVLLNFLKRSETF